MRRLLLLIAGLIVLTGAEAAPVTYTFSGQISGSVGATAFTNQSFTLIATGVSETVQNGVTPYYNALNSGVITITGTACSAGCTLSTPPSYVVFNTGALNAMVHGISTAGQVNVSGQTLFEACFDPQCSGGSVNDNLVSNVPLTISGDANALAPYMPFPTSGGTVTISSIANGALGYAVSTIVPPVPTTSYSSLMLLALMLAAFSMFAVRRQRIRK